jgi:hypothetical protein
MHLKKLRDLRLAVAPQAGRPRHLSAASGLVRVGSVLYVVADDELHLGAFKLHGSAPGTLIRLLPGDLPDALEDRKKQKADFEALTLLPRFPRYPRGALLALGSGSRKQRRRGVLMKLNEAGVDARSARVIDASKLFDAIEREVDDLNVEGAVVIGKRLLLMHRGNKSHAGNAIASFDLDAMLESIGQGDSIAKVPMLGIERYDLGGVEGVPLCFTDGAALGDGRLVFAAVAEDTADNYNDGPCRAAAIGTLSATGKLESLHYLDTPHKIEGIHAQSAKGVVKLWLVTDGDDARVPASLLAGELR